MTEKPIDLDDRRDATAQKETEARRQLYDVKIEHEARRHRQEELDHHFADTPAASWAELAPKLRYLLHLYALTPEAQEPRRKRLLDRVAADIDLLAGDPT